VIHIWLLSPVVTLGGVAFTENDGHDPWTGIFHPHPGVELQGSAAFLKYGMLKDMGVSKNRGTPKWMVYNGKPY